MGRWDGLSEAEIQAAKDERNRKDRERRAAKRAAKEAAGKPRPMMIPDEQLSSLDKRNLYLAYRERGHNRTDCADKVGVKYGTIKYWRRTDDKFRQAEEDIESAFVDRVEDALIAQIQTDYASINDKLRFLEKARPERWGQRSKVEHEHTLQFDGSVDERLSRVRALLESQGRDTAILEAYVVEDKALPASLPTPQ